MPPQLHRMALPGELAPWQNAPNAVATPPGGLDGVPDGVPPGAPPQLLRQDAVMLNGNGNGGPQPLALDFANASQSSGSSHSDAPPSAGGYFRRFAPARAMFAPMHPYMMADYDDDDDDYEGDDYNDEDNFRENGSSDSRHHRHRHHHRDHDPENDSHRGRHGHHHGHHGHHRHQHHHGHHEGGAPAAEGGKAMTWREFSTSYYRQQQQSRPGLKFKDALKEASPKWAQYKAAHA